MRGWEGARDVRPLDGNVRRWTGLLLPVRGDRARGMRGALGSGGPLRMGDMRAGRKDEPLGAWEGLGMTLGTGAVLVSEGPSQDRIGGVPLRPLRTLGWGCWVEGPLGGGLCGGRWVSGLGRAPSHMDAVTKGAEMPPLSRQNNPPYNTGAFRFELTFSPHHPLEPPRATLRTPIHHPSVDLQGRVCQPLTTNAHWKPTTRAIQGGYRGDRGTVPGVPL